MKKVIFLVDKVEEERLRQIESIREMIKNNRISFEKESEKQALYITSDEQNAKTLQEHGYAVAGYLTMHQKFAGLQWIIEPIKEDGFIFDDFERIYRRCKKMPWNIMETERLSVRETTTEDVDDFYEIYAEPAVTKYIENLFENPDMEKAYTENYRDTIYELYGFGMWTVLEKESGKVIGRAGISMREGYDQPELGFIIGVPWQRKGYAYEVCDAILTYAREELGFRTMICFIKKENDASLRLCAKLGFNEIRMTQLGEEKYLMLEKYL